MAEIQEKKKGGILGGNLLPKILILIAVGLLLSVVFFGIKLTISDIFWTVARVVFAVILLVLVIKGLEQFIGKKSFSPTERFKSKLIRIAELSKPFNVKELYLRGEDMRVYSFWGKISGLAFIPYLTGSPKTDEKGTYKYVVKKDKAGNEMLDGEGKPIYVHDLSNVSSKDGEWLFVVKRGFFLFASTELIRSDIKFVSDIGEKIFIKTVNLCPIGDYWYPYQQWQKDILRTQVQHQAEAVIETHNYFLDLIATVTESSLRADPMFQRMMQANTEAISQKEVTGGNQLMR